MQALMTEEDWEQLFKEIEEEENEYKNDNH